MSQMLSSVLAQADRIAGAGAELGVIAGVAPAHDAAANAAAGFASSLKDVLHAVDAQGHAASEQLAAVDSGRSNDLVGAMLASQQADLSFSMLLQVRNKVAGAVDELIKLQL